MDRAVVNVTHLRLGALADAGLAAVGLRDKNRTGTHLGATCATG